MEILIIKSLTCITTFVTVFTACAQFQKISLIPTEKLMAYNVYVVTFSLELWHLFSELINILLT